MESVARSRKAPRPGRPVRGSHTGRPIMALFDLLGRRWALRILWELRGAPLTFRPLREACGGISPAVLSARLAELREAGIVEAASGEDPGYALSREGTRLVEALGPIADWAERWGRRSR